MGKASSLAWTVAYWVEEPYKPVLFLAILLRLQQFVKLAAPLLVAHSIAHKSSKPLDDGCLSYIDPTDHDSAAVLFGGSCPGKA